MFDYARFNDLVAETGKSRAYIGRKINRPNYYFRDCANSNKELPDSEVEIIANELGTTVAYLRGETDSKNPPADAEGEKVLRAMLESMSAAELYELAALAAKLAQEKTT